MNDYPYVQSDDTPEIDAEANEWGVSQQEKREIHKINRTNAEVVEYIKDGEGTKTANAIAEDLLNARAEISKLKGLIWLIQRCAEAGAEASRPARIISICKSAWIMDQQDHAHGR